MKSYFESPLCGPLLLYVLLFLCSFSILPDMGSFSVILLAWLFTLFTFPWTNFLYIFVIFSFSSFLYSLWPNLFTCWDLPTERNTLLLFLICFMSLLSLSWKLLFIFLNSMFFIISKRSFSKFDSSSTAGGHLIDWKA